MHAISANQIRFVLFVIWLTLFILLNSDPLLMLAEYGLFSLLGILGAIFANSTGAGGGVIFVPFFSRLGFTNETIVATSFAIQCFGMTAGAISWYVFRRNEKQNDPEWSELARVLLYTVPASVLGIILVQISQIQSPNSLHATFGGFSVFLALAIFASIPMLKNASFVSRLNKADVVALPAVALIGGAITAWLSVGVGELVAIYLIFRRFNVSFAIACAVILSAFSVWGGVQYHLVETQAIYWPVLAFAGLGAVIGGSIARYLVLWFSVTRLKIFFAFWVLILGVASIPL